MAKTSTKTAAHKAAIGNSIARARKSKTPQETAANAVSTSLAEISRIVGVLFPSSNTVYSYLTNDPTLDVGDYALVISPQNRDFNATPFYSEELKGYPTVIRVVEVRETVKAVNAANKWIVTKLDMSEAIASMARAEQIEVLKAKITKARKAAEEQVKLEQLRSLSPELGALIDELAVLEGRG